jgi:CBS domain containing-hemolysin-like protein
VQLSVVEQVVLLSALPVLLGLNAVFVAAEFGLVKLRFTRFDSRESEEARASLLVAAMLSRLGRSLKVIRFGVTTCTVALGFALVPLVLLAIRSFGIDADGAVGRLALAFSFILAVAIHFVLGELVPRALGLQHPARALRWTAWPVRLFGLATAPLFAALDAGSKRLLRAFRIDPSLDLDLVNVEAQIRSLVSNGEELPAIAAKILDNVLDLRKRVAQDILLPRNQIQYFDLYDGIAANLELAKRTGHTRFPLCEGDLDRCIGIVHIKDIFRSKEDLRRLDLRKLRREILRFSPDEPLENVLQRFLKSRLHFGLLVDEFGGTVGAITLENVLEEVVGDIQDEFDKEDAVIEPLADGEFSVDGLAPIHEVAEALGVELDDSEVSTFGGLITSELGRMPKANAPFRLGQLEVVVTKLDERRIIGTRVRLAAKLDPERDDG